MDKEQILNSSCLFEIDSAGRVWRIAKRHGRGVKTGGGYHKGATMSPCNRVRAEYRQRQGYLLVAATVDGKRTVTGAHRMVWVWMHGPIPSGLTVNHLNGIKDDNRPANLELATMSEQRRHAVDILNVNRNHPTGSKHPKTILTETDVLTIRQLRVDGMMVKELADRYAMKPKAISAICCRRTWTHI